MNIAANLHEKALKAQQEIAKAQEEIFKEKAEPIIKSCADVAERFGQMEMQFSRKYGYDVLYEAEIISYLRRNGFKVSVKEEYIVISW